MSKIIKAKDGDFSHLPDEVKQKALTMADGAIKIDPYYSLFSVSGRMPNTIYRTDLNNAKWLDGDKNTTTREEVAAYLLALASRHHIEWKENQSESIHSMIGLKEDSSPNIDYVVTAEDLKSRPTHTDDRPSVYTVNSTAQRIYNTVFKKAGVELVSSDTNDASVSYFFENVRKDNATDFIAR